MELTRRSAGEGYADVVIVAAGQSRRMGGQDKILAPLAGRPLLSWAVDAVLAAPAVGRVVVVAGPDRADALRQAAWLQATGASVVVGGAWRSQSSRAGLAATHPEAEVVLVHDGARPLVSPRLVEAIAQAARAHGAAIPVAPILDSVKRVADGRVVAAVERDGLAAAQTPQGARRQVLLDAFAAADGHEPDRHTDEASILAAAGVTVVTVPGQADNLKVTTPDDLARAEAIAAARLRPRRPAAGPATRLAQGRDSHPFGPRQGLALGGITIPEAPRLAGHSDGDAALHALADAILGGARLGDLGRLFPAADPATEGSPSGPLLEATVRLAAQAGWRPVAVDLTIEGARPRLGPERLERMRAAIAALTGLAAEEISVRASSGNLDGPTGAGRSIAAQALVELAPVEGRR